MTTVGTLHDGARGFDANRQITAPQADAFKQAGYFFAVRYVRRAQPHSYDVSTGEVLTILGAGLGLMLVQHVAPDGWKPTPALGATYGAIAGTESMLVGLPKGVTVWCDLEGVAAHVPHADVIGFCNQWYLAVSAAGYEPGLYVGYGCGLTATELYAKLKFTRYWGAYNLNADNVPAVRGLCMRQSVAKDADLVKGFSVQTMDVDVIRADAKGGTPSLLLP